MVALRGVGGPNRLQYSFLRFLYSVRPPTGEGRQGKALWEGCDASRVAERGQSDLQSTVPGDVRDEDVGAQVPLLAHGPCALVHQSRFALLSGGALVAGHGSSALLSGACQHAHESYVACLREPYASLCVAHQLVHAPYSSVHVLLHDAELQDHRLHSVTSVPDSSVHARYSCAHAPLHDAELQGHRHGHSVTSVPDSSVHAPLHDAELQGHLVHAPCAHVLLHDAELRDRHPCLAQVLVPSAQQTGALTLLVLQEVLLDDPFALHELLAADVLPPASCLFDLQSLAISLRFADLLQQLGFGHSSAVERHVSLRIAA